MKSGSPILHHFTTPRSLCHGAANALPGIFLELRLWRQRAAQAAAGSRGKDVAFVQAEIHLSWLVG